MSAIIQAVIRLLAIFLPRLIQAKAPEPEQKQMPKRPTGGMAGYYEAKQFFLDNLDAYRRGKQVWGKHITPDSDECNSALYTGDAIIYRQFEVDKDKSIFYHVGTWPGGESDFHLLQQDNVTFCNQALGLFTWHMFGIDLDRVAGIDYNANKICEKIEAGFYRLKFKQIDAAQIDRDCLTIACWHNPGGIGHVAIIDIDKTGPDDIHIIQAGAKTGCMTLAQGFGAYKSMVKFYEVTK